MKTIRYASGCILRVRRCTLVIEVRAVCGGLTARRDACAAVAERRSKHYMLHVIMLSRVSCLLCQRIKPLPLLQTNCHRFVLPARLPRQFNNWGVGKPSGDCSGRVLSVLRFQPVVYYTEDTLKLTTRRKDHVLCQNGQPVPLDTSVVPVPIHRIHYSLSLLEFFII